MKPLSFDFLKRKKDTHKKDYGHILIISGSTCYTGAVYLCSQGALRSGAGLVTLAVPSSVHPIIASRVIEATTLPVSDKQGSFTLSSKKKIFNFIKNIDSVVIGPGISRAKNTQKFVLDLLSKINIPVVIDADALYPLKKHRDIIASRKHPTVLTPHPGEMSQLTGMSVELIQKDRVGISKSIAERWNCIVVLKGHRTVCTDGNNIYINNTGNPGMASGGTGDVLSGIIGAFLGMKIQAYEASCCAVYIHGLAADMAVKKVGMTSLLAGDIISYLPQAFLESSKIPGQVKGRPCET